jgi:putative ABC transport system permease protein
MFYLSFAFSELRRRRGRTLLTALGLAVGVALVITVNALSTGLDGAQAKVLSPLTGVGTDMTVTRPLKLSTSGGNPFSSLTPSERAQLRSESGGGRLGLRNLGKPGQHFNSDRFTTATQLSFPQSDASKFGALPGVAGASSALTVTDIHLSGTIPKTAPQPSSGTSGQGPGRFGGGFGGGQAGALGGPNSINFDSRTITGVDRTNPGLAPVTPGQVINGHYFPAGGTSYSAILSTAYAARNNLSVGSSISIGGKTFHVVGLTSAPLGSTGSDVYVELSVLQKISNLSGRVNTVQVRATNSNEVTSVQHEVSKSLSGAQVTTAADLAKRIGGSLTDAKNLSNSLGFGLETVGLLAAALIAILLTLASVAKRVREIGTLKAIGWSQGTVVRQISLESLAQGVIGGVIGAALGLGAAGVIDAMRFTLKATVSAPAQTSGFGFGRLAQQSLSAGSTIVRVNAPVDLALILTAVGLAALAGLIAGAIGGLRAARLRPAVALRTVE